MNNRLRIENKITMDTIAETLSVSKTTVSRALSGKGRIGKETRERIMDYINSFGYKPNEFARALAGVKTCNIAVVIPDSAEKGTAPFFKDCLVGVMQASVKRDYDTILSVVSKGDYSNVKRLVEKRKVDGVVLTRCDEDNEMISYLQDEGMPFVLIGRNNGDVLQIDTDQEEGCCELTLKMLEGNSDKVAYMAGSPEMDIEKLRYEGYSQAFWLAGREVEKDLVFWDSENTEDFLMDRILDSNVKCLICSDDLICMNVMNSLKNRGVIVPERIKVVSFYDSEYLENNPVPVTSLHIDAKDLSQRACNLLIDNLEGIEVKNRNVVKCSVVYRNSSR